MVEVSYLQLILSSICITEYFFLSLYILFKIKNRKYLGIESSSIIHVFWSLVLILTTLRTLGFILVLFIKSYIYEIFERIAYLANFNLYSLMCYSWYPIYRLSLYFTYTFHISDSHKALYISRTKWAIISFDVIGIVSLLILAGIYYNSYSFDILRLEQPDDILAFRIYYFTYVWIIYGALIITGCLLVRQVNKYCTEKPLVLIISLYFILADFTFAICILTLMMVGTGEISEELR